MDPGTYQPGYPLGPPQCRMKRAELEQLLDRCGYGANVEMFNCYFRAGLGGPPLCIYCNMAIQAHEDPVEPASGVPVSGDRLAADLAVEISDINWYDRISGLEAHGSTDGIRTPYPIVLVLLMIAFVAIALLLVVIFSAVGLYKTAPPAYAACGVLLFVGGVLGLFVSKRNVLFHKDTRDVEYEVIFLYCCCCPTKIRTSFDNLGSVEAQDTHVRINRQPLFIIVVKLIEPVDGIEDVKVMRYLGYVGLEEQVSDWRLYLYSLTGQIHG